MPFQHAVSSPTLLLITATVAGFILLAAGWSYANVDPKLTRLKVRNIGGHEQRNTHYQEPPTLTVPTFASPPSPPPPPHQAIEGAIVLVEKDFAQVEHTRAQLGNNNTSMRRTLSQVTSDIDFIFEEMDKISGNEAVKKRRKVLVDRLRVLGDRVDAVIASLPH